MHDCAVAARLLKTLKGVVIVTFQNGFQRGLRLSGCLL